MAERTPIDELLDLDPPDDGPGRRAAHEPGAARALRVGRPGAGGDSDGAARRRRRRPQARRQDRPSPSGARRRGRARSVPAHGRPRAAARRSGIPAVAREYSRPAQPAVRQGASSSRAISWRSRWSARATARPMGRGSPNGWRPRWRGRASRSSRAWPAASTRPLTAGRSRPAVERSPSSPTGWRRSILPSTRTWPAPSSKPVRLLSEMPMRQGPLAGLVHPAEPDHLRARPGRRRGRGDAAQRLAVDRRVTRSSRIARSSPCPGRSTACPAEAAIA